MNIKKAGKMTLLTIAAALMSIVPGLGMEVAAKLKPDAYDLGGYLYQLIGRTFNTFHTDPLTLAVLFCAMFWLAKRYLFHKPQETGLGEYALCGLLALIMLVCASMRAEGTIQTIWANVFQLFKAVLYFAGMYCLDLCLLRGFAELLHRKWPNKPCRLWVRHPFAFPCIVLSIAWIGHVIVKYPGAINLDIVMPIRQYIGLTPRANDFPVLGTLVYGWLFTLGQKIGNVNITYFLVTLTQVLGLLFTLSYAMWLMNRRNVSVPLQIMSLVLFAVSPLYIGWAMIIIKDAQYLVLMLLLGTMLTEFLLDSKAFLSKKSRWLLLAADLILLIFTRNNGVFIVLPTAAMMALVVLCRKSGWKKAALIAVLAGMSIVFTSCVNSLIITRMGMNEIRFYDYLSIPFQQTARVAKLHGDEGLTEDDKAAISTMIDYDVLAEKYNPQRADAVKTSVDVIERGKHSPNGYLAVWWKQFRQYPLDYLDAFLGMSYYMFDLQSNVPVYNSYADIDEYIYPYAFHEKFFFNAEEIQPLIHPQLALTEGYFRFDDLPLIGQFASMGFCMHVLMASIYLAWVNHRRNTILMMIPSIITAFMTMFCPEVYVRYLLPVMAALPLWLAAYQMDRH